MTMASLTASLLARKGHAQPSASARDIFAPDLPAEKRWQATAKQVSDVPKHSDHAGQATQRLVKTEAATIAANEQICSAPQKASEQTPPRPLFAPVEARHTPTAQTGEVVRPSAAKAQSPTADNRKHKTLRLDEEMDMQLRLLAARKGTSQQALMEEAVRDLLKSETRSNSCICGSKK